MDPIRHLRFSFAALVSIIAIGTFGYSMVEGWSLFDSLYMTVITLATVGFQRGSALIRSWQIIHHRSDYQRYRHDRLHPQQPASIYP